MLLGALLVACATPEGPTLRAPASSSPRATRPALAPDSPAAFFADVVGTVHAQYLDPIAVARLATAARAMTHLQSLPESLHNGSSPTTFAQRACAAGRGRESALALTTRSRHAIDNGREKSRFGPTVYVTRRGPAI